MALGFGRGRRGGKWNDTWGRPWMGRLGVSGPPANCICPRCGFLSPKEPGVRCFEKKCPRCGSPMARQLIGEK